MCHRVQLWVDAVSATANGSHMVTTAYDGQARVVISGRPMDITIIVNTVSNGAFGIGVGTPTRLNQRTCYYNTNHAMAWLYDAWHGLVNTDWTGPDGTYAPRHAAGRRVVVLMVRGGTLSFSVDGVVMPGTWPIPSPANIIVSPGWAGGTVDISATLM